MKCHLKCNVLTGYLPEHRIICYVPEMPCWSAPSVGKGGSRADGCSTSVEGWGSGVPGLRSAPHSQGLETKVCWVFEGSKGPMSARFFFERGFRPYVVKACLSWAWARSALSLRVCPSGPLMSTKPGSGRHRLRLFHHTSPSLQCANE